MELKQKIIAVPHVKKYYEKLIDEMERQFGIASKARATGKDIEQIVESKPTTDLADRTENIIGPKGIAKRYREIFKEMKGDRLKTIFKIFKEIMERTKSYNDYVLNFALGYGSREEITQAVRDIVEKAVKGEIRIEDIDEKLISQNLYLKNEPDLLIRPGGEKRISNFLLWQLSYAELIFLDKLLPELTKEDFRQCIEEFGRRQRRFGE